MILLMVLVLYIRLDIVQCLTEITNTEPIFTLKESNVQLPCYFQKEHQYIRWSVRYTSTNDFYYLHQFDRNRNNIDKDYHNLTLLNVSLNDAGLYTCISFTNDDQLHIQIELIILDEIIGNSSGVVLSSDDTLNYNLVCNVSFLGNIHPKVLWATSDMDKFRSLGATSTDFTSKNNVISTLKIEMIKDFFLSCNIHDANNKTILSYTFDSNIECNLQSEVFECEFYNKTYKIPKKKHSNSMPMIMDSGNETIASVQGRIDNETHNWYLLLIVPTVVIMIVLTLAYLIRRKHEK